MKKTTVDNRLNKILEDLTGLPVNPVLSVGNTLNDSVHRHLADGMFHITFSQFNEILLSYGYNRHESEHFFQFLVDGTSEYIDGSIIESFKHFEIGVKRFRELAMLRFNNIRYGYRRLMENKDLLDIYIEVGQEKDIEDLFGKRSKPVHSFEDIPGTETPYVGYLMNNVEGEEEKIRDKVRQQAIRNYQAYLASEYLDVYIATSMRKASEYYQVNKLIKLIFDHDLLEPLNLRWFDPTQTYCEDRIDKGLFEALMLKKALCTIYMAQESDSFGKDSELASTLAQGKIVIGYVPEVNESYFTEWFIDQCRINSDMNEMDILIDQLRVFNPGYAWEADNKLNEWNKEPLNKENIEAAKVILTNSMKEHYDIRAENLSINHPLGIQVALDTGVTNGVLVVRDVENCAKLLRGIFTSTLEFDLIQENSHLCLREFISNCVLRVQIGDKLLSNSFWNFYID